VEAEASKQVDRPLPLAAEASQDLELPEEVAAASYSGALVGTEAAAVASMVALFDLVEVVDWAKKVAQPSAWVEVEKNRLVVVEVGGKVALSLGGQRHLQGVVEELE